MATCHRWGVTERREDIGIVVSELLANALRHALPERGHIAAGWPVRLGLLHHGPCVLCAVTDPDPHPPVPKAPACLAETGRGLHIVAALSDEWGYVARNEPHHAGKIVWAVFVAAVPPGAGTPADRTCSPAGRGAGTSVASAPVPGAGAR